MNAADLDMTLLVTAAHALGVNVALIRLSPGVYATVAMGVWLLAMDMRWRHRLVATSLSLKTLALCVAACRVPSAPLLLMLSLCATMELLHGLTGGKGRLAVDCMLAQFATCAVFINRSDDSVDFIQVSVWFAYVGVLTAFIAAAKGAQTGTFSATIDARVAALLMLSNSDTEPVLP